jgi:hypothetical protein
MAKILTQSIAGSGAPPTFGNAATGDTADCGTGLRLELRNSTASVITVTLVTPGVLETGDAYPDKAVPVPAAVAGVPGEARPPLLPVYRDPADGLCHITYSATTGLTRAVVRS